MSKLSKSSDIITAHMNIIYISYIFRELTYKFLHNAIIQMPKALLFIIGNLYYIEENCIYAH